MMESVDDIDNVYFFKDHEGVDLPDTDGIKVVCTDGCIANVPPDPANRHWQLYQDWLAVPNTTQTEP